jgi:hypothetical protein
MRYSVSENQVVFQMDRDANVPGFAVPSLNETPNSKRRQFEFAATKNGFG